MYTVGNQHDITFRIVENGYAYWVNMNRDRTFSAFGDRWILWGLSANKTNPNSKILIRGYVSQLEAAFLSGWIIEHPGWLTLFPLKLDLQEAKKRCGVDRVMSPEYLWFETEWKKAVDILPFDCRAACRLGFVRGGRPVKQIISRSNDTHDTLSSEPDSEEPGNIKKAIAAVKSIYSVTKELNRLLG